MRSWLVRRLLRRNPSRTSFRRRSPRQWKWAVWNWWAYSKPFLRRTVLPTPLNSSKCSLFDKYNPASSPLFSRLGYLGAQASGRSDWVSFGSSTVAKVRYSDCLDSHLASTLLKHKVYRDFRAGKTTSYSSDCPSNWVASRQTTWTRSCHQNPPTSPRNPAWGSTRSFLARTTGNFLPSYLLVLTHI